jgi:hypothetical protein
MAVTPSWASELLVIICKQYKRKPPKLHWHQAKSYRSADWQPVNGKMVLVNVVKKARSGSSGYASPHHGIHVFAGTDPVDQRLVLLHEAAHWLTKPRKGSKTAWGHTVKFWATHFALCDKYGVDLQVALARGKRYKVKSQQGYDLYLKTKTA